MKSSFSWKSKLFALCIMLILAMFVAGCGSDGWGDPPRQAAAVDPVEPWTVTATAADWLTTNPYNDKHDGGWVYSAREDVLYAIYPESYSNFNLYRIDHIGETSAVATTYVYGRHGSHPVIDDTGTYIYLLPSEETNQLERYNTVTDELETLAAAPQWGTFSHGAWKDGKLWIVLNDYHLYQYDPGTNVWNDAMEVFSGRANVASSGPASNLIYIIRRDAGDFFSYDVMTATLTALDPHPYGFNLGGNGQFTWFGADVGFIYAMGGCSGTSAIYDIAGGEWHSMDDPKTNSNCVGHATYDTSRSRLYVADGSSNAFYYQF
ncbi:MAG: hypothetical protein QMD11_13370 [Smithella sp.]|nr:hypothetical protein [Smithella sp.]